jgi:hypothetical protein
MILPWASTGLISTFGMIHQIKIVSPDNKGAGGMGGMSLRLRTSRCPTMAQVAECVLSTKDKTVSFNVEKIVLSKHVLQEMRERNSRRFQFL